MYISGESQNIPYLGERKGYPRRISRWPLPGGIKMLFQRKLKMSRTCWNDGDILLEAQDGLYLGEWKDILEEAQGRTYLGKCKGDLRGSSRCLVPVGIKRISQRKLNMSRFWQNERDTSYLGEWKRISEPLEMKGISYRKLKSSRTWGN